MALDIDDNLAVDVPAGPPSNVIQFPITTERLIIRRFEPDDLAPCLSFVLNPESTRYLAFELSQTTEEDARGHLTMSVPRTIPKTPFIYEPLRRAKPALHSE